MIDIAVVGLGIIGADHLMAIENSGDFRLAAVCDKSEERAREFAERYSVPYFLDYKEIPKKTEARAVIINLPHFLHCESAVFFLEAGFDVLLEKNEGFDEIIHLVEWAFSHKTGMNDEMKSGVATTLLGVLKKYYKMQKENTIDNLI